MEAASSVKNHTYSAVWKEIVNGSPLPPLLRNTVLPANCSLAALHPASDKADAFCAAPGLYRQQAQHFSCTCETKAVVNTKPGAMPCIAGSRKRDHTSWLA